MPAEEPSWWYAAEAGGKPGAQPRLLSGLLRPIAHLWGAAAVRRFANTTPFRSALPVICVGNFTAGGTGKTPLSIHISRALLAHGERPAFLTRGYGGRHKGPRRVDLGVDSAADVGDEALLLARAAPTLVSRDRARGAATLAAFSGLSAPTVIVMDDGLQNPGLAKDLTIAVVDGRRGIGNGEVIPSGPLRAPLAFQLGLVDAIVVNRPPSRSAGQPEGENEIARVLRQRFIGPVLEASVEPDGDQAGLAGARVVALAGIANPGRFHDLLAAMGAEIVEKLNYRDHHPFTEAEARHVLARAATLQADIVTTEKDWVRLPRSPGALGELRDRARPLPIRLAFGERDALRLASLLERALTERRKRTPSGRAS